MGVILKPHNQEPYAELSYMLKEHDRAAIISATGTGKSYIAAAYVQNHDLEEHTLILVPKAPVKRAWKELLPKARVENYQKICVSGCDLTGIKVIICDEMHHLGGQKWGAAFRKLIENFHGKIIGLSATPIRILDGNRDIALEFFDGNTIFGLPLSKAIQTNVLPTFTYVTALFDLPGFIAKAGIDWTHRNQRTEHLYTRLDTELSKANIHQILKKYLEQKSPVKAAVFVNQMDQIAEIRNSLKECFPDALHLEAHYKQSDEENQEIFQRFSEESKDVFLYTIDILNEGAHLDGINTVIMFRKTGSPIVYLQQLGRGLSVGNDGEEIHIFDLVANHTNLKGYKNTRNSVIAFLNWEIGEGSNRQIAVDDRALPVIEITDIIRKVESGFWIREEDNILTTYYDGGKGVAKIHELIPHHSEASIRARARTIGLAVPKTEYQRSEEYIKDLKEWYLQEDGMKRLMEKYPDVAESTIRFHARQFRLLRKSSPVRWTEEDVALLRENHHLPMTELMKLFPNYTKQAIAGKKSELGLRMRPKVVWTEEDDDIIRNHPDMTSPELQKKFFPDKSKQAITKQRKKIFQVNSLSSHWSKEKRERFCTLYQAGGIPKVKNDPEFASMAKNTIGAAATRFGVYSGNAPAPWTTEEKDRLRHIALTQEKVSWKALESEFPGRNMQSLCAMGNKMRREAQKATSNHTKRERRTLSVCHKTCKTTDQGAVRRQKEVV